MAESLLHCMEMQRISKVAELSCREIPTKGKKAYVVVRYSSTKLQVKI